MNFKKRNHVIDFIFPVIILFVFALLALFVILFAANSYKKNLNSSASNNPSLTAASYVYEKIHQAGEKDGIYIGEIDGTNALILETSDAEGSNLTTYIYCYDGYLRELYLAERASASAAFGQKIIELKDFNAEIIKAGLVQIICTDKDGNSINQLAAF